MGKTTVAEALVARFRWPFKDGKALVPEVNTAKMHAGPLIQRLAASAKIDESARLAWSL